MEFLSKESQFKSLHLIPIKLLKLIVKQAYLYSSHHDMSYDWRELYGHSRVLRTGLGAKEFQQCCKAVLGVVTWLLQNNPENTGKYTFRNIFSTHTSIEEEKMNDLEEEYENAMMQCPDQGVLKTGLQLVDVDWRAGITVSTDSASNLNIPYVELLLKFIDPQSGISSNTTINLDYQNFIAFLRDTRKINGLLATYN